MRYCVSRISCQGESVKTQMLWRKNQSGRITRTIRLPKFYERSPALASSLLKIILPSLTSSTLLPLFGSLQCMALVCRPLQGDHFRWTPTFEITQRHQSRLIIQLHLFHYFPLPRNSCSVPVFPRFVCPVLSRGLTCFQALAPMCDITTIESCSKNNEQAEIWYFSLCSWSSFSIQIKRT